MFDDLHFRSYDHEQQMSTNEASSGSNSVPLFRYSGSEVSSSQRYRGSRERRRHDGGGSTCDTDT